MSSSYHVLSQLYHLAVIKRTHVNYHLAENAILADLEVRFAHLSPENPKSSGDNDQCRREYIEYQLSGDHWFFNITWFLTHDVVVDGFDPQTVTQNDNYALTNLMNYHINNKQLFRWHIKRLYI